MRIKELINENDSAPYIDSGPTKMPHLYLDMDGVQADFFGAWSKRSGVEHWKSIADKEKEINELAHSDPKEVYKFFRDLDPLSGGMKVIQWIRKNKIPYTVLSAPLRGPYSQASIKAKRDWLDEFHPGSSSNAIFTQNKAKHAMEGGIPNVLVDDYGKYLNAWAAAGGIAVKHEDQYEDPDTAQHTIEKLEKIYKPFLNK
jgi:5'(3')-deoxyribonucleotidase